MTFTIIPEFEHGDDDADQRGVQGKRSKHETVQTLCHLHKALIHLLETFVHLLEALVDLLEALPHR